eukprot:scaffold568584_cov35-Prasinocladus_malaysianus.AAC.1
MDSVIRGTEADVLESRVMALSLHLPNKISKYKRAATVLFMRDLMWSIYCRTGDGPKVTMATRFRFVQEDPTEIPGPGAYKPE